MGTTYTQALLHNIKCSQHEKYFKKVIHDSHRRGWRRRGPRSPTNQKNHQQIQNKSQKNPTILTDEDGEEEDPGHPTAGHEEDLGDVLRLLVLPD